MLKLHVAGDPKAPTFHAGTAAKVLEILRRSNGACLIYEPVAVLQED